MSKQPTAPGMAPVSAIQRPSGGRTAGPRTAVDGLTRAQARALSRCAPLKPADFKTSRTVADQGLVPLRGLRDEGDERRGA